jgi:hypothetical protein
MAEKVGIQAGMAEIHQQGHFLGGQTQQVFVVVMDDFHRNLPKEKARNNCRTFAQNPGGDLLTTAAPAPLIGGDGRQGAEFQRSRLAGVRVWSGAIEAVSD